jgi:hypothetical protein
MNETYLNEAAAPKLLPQKFQLVDCLVNICENIDNDIQTENRKRSLGEKSGSELECSIHRMEFSRINHVINSYLR